MAKKNEQSKETPKAQKTEPIIVAQIMGKWVGGGVEAVIMNYYRHIDRSKIQFDFICDEDSTNIPYEEIEKLGGKVILCPPYQKLPKYLKFLKNLFREKKYRIVHSNINTLSVFPLYAAKKAGVPVRIAHSHSTSNPKEWKKNLLKNALRPFSKKYATDYFACSELAGRYLFGNKTFNRGEVKIIHNAIDVEKFKYDPEARKKLRKEIGIKDDDFVIGHIGRFVEQKNHRFLIDIFAEVKKEKINAKLVLVGQGPLREEIEENVKNLGLEKDVFFLGQRSDTNKLYSVFDVFCLPSLYEGLPVVGVEAQANGVPCVFSVQITKETVINKNVELIDIKEPGEKDAKSVLRCGERIVVEGYPFDICINANNLFEGYFAAIKRKIKINPIKQVAKSVRLKINKIRSKKRAKELGDIKPTIIANNCFAGIIYQYLGLKYYSPTIGLYFFATDYVKFVKNFDYYIDQSLTFIPLEESAHMKALVEKGDAYCPIGKLGDIEIVFLHYKTEEEARIKWEKRIKRINKTCLIFKFSEQNECSREIIEEFSELPISNKMIFVTQKNSDICNTLCFKEDKKGEVAKDYYEIHRFLDVVNYIKRLKTIPHDNQERWISVIMGTYNPKSKEALDRAISSILNQTYPYFEFIICNDGSTNECRKWLNEASKKDCRIKLIENEKNLGLAKTLNNCLAHSRYGLIARMDDDDYCCADRLEKQLNYLMTHIDVDLVSTNMNFTDGKHIYATTHFPEQIKKKNFLNNSPIMHPTVLAYKESFLDVGGYNESLSVERMEDYDLFMRMQISGKKMATYQEPLYEYYYDLNAQKKRKNPNYRLNEAKLRLKRFCQLGMLPIGLIYSIKPLVALLLPAGFIYKVGNCLRNNKNEKNKR